jgi:hypothetical protein
VRVGVRDLLFLSGSTRSFFGSVSTQRNLDFAGSMLRAFALVPFALVPLPMLSPLLCSGGLLPSLARRDMLPEVEGRESLERRVLSGLSGLPSSPPHAGCLLRLYKG